ncbi:hydrogenase subunit MbhD domain-containing protein [Sulfitobacter sp.]|uniref:hydrogenase subunit MbhD domain-containing protein n=1 Tax=Sulfitobacter sp. TaxID=1903071 RepID=UPI0030019086
MSLAFDILLAFGVVFTAAAALGTHDRVASVAGFVVTGLLVALSLVRLGAPDVALAEAAIGAGLTGALLLRSARCLKPAKRPILPSIQRIFAVIIAAGLTVALVWAFYVVPSATLYPALIDERLADSGVTNPVTAVLLNFRAWDTLLEIVVLFVALVLVRIVAPGRPQPVALGELMLPFARIIVPISAFLAGHLLWQGASEPGGAFQAGAILTGGLLILILGGFAEHTPRLLHWVMMLALWGLAVFALAALGAEAFTGTLLLYPEGAAKLWILLIEAALTLSIAATLCLLFYGIPRRLKNDI